MFDLKNRETVEAIEYFLDALRTADGFHKFANEQTENLWCCMDFDEEDCSIHSGCTKGVIVPYDYDFVIKVPFYHHLDKEIDYCKLEVANYANAVDEGLAEYFAQTEFYRMFHGFPIYIQQKVECNQDDNSDAICNIAYQSYLEYSGEEDSEDTRDHYFSSIYDSDGDADLLMENEWGNDVFCRVWDFCDANHINDIHTGNIGYLNGKLVVIDFSGYNLSYEWYIRHCYGVA